MPSTKNTIHENWQGAVDTAKSRNTVYHFAIMQAGIGLDMHLRSFFSDKEISMHYFETFDQLFEVCQRYQIDVIFIAGRGDYQRELRMLHAIRQNVFLAVIPIILFHPNPDESTVITAYENGAEDFIYGDWRRKLVEVRIKRVISRNRRDLSINPSTHLPGPAMIETEISRLIDMQAEFAACYADLDNFKAYNDYYGYYSGDRVIRLTAKIIKDVVFDMCREGFLGHIAGDDFIFIIPAYDVDRICGRVLEVFDRLIPYRYAKEDRKRGYISTTDRKGEMCDFPLLTMSIAVMINDNGKFKHVGEMSHMLADLKKAVKMKDGSTYMVERRCKY